MRALDALEERLPVAGDRPKSALRVLVRVFPGPAEPRYFAGDGPIARPKHIRGPGGVPTINLAS
jgi:hypothetical protein